MTVIPGADMRTEYEPYGALYLHIPFCAQRCAYCDFTTEAAAPDDPRLDVYAESLIRELRSAAREGLLTSIRSIYIGGGSPSFLGARRLVQLAYTIGLSINLTDVEFTVEANPEQVSAALVRDLVALGVNRFSLGVQSFDDRELQALERIHDAQRAREAIAAIQERCDNLSIDLMCGIPGQTQESWQASLAMAVGLDLPHVSVYPLSIEEGTPFREASERGALVFPDEDMQADMMEQAAAALSRQGLTRYEVASYARPGYECRHNQAYWTGIPYLGLGRGAAGMRQNVACRERLLDGQVIETLTPAQAAAEDLMLGMRLSAGIACEKLTEASALLPAAPALFTELVTLGLLVADADTVTKGVKGVRGSDDTESDDTESDDGGTRYACYTRYRPSAHAWLLGNELYTRIWSLA